MAVVDLGVPPNLGEAASHRDYRGWLLTHFFDHLCSYCLLRDDNAQVDHYEPVQFAPARCDDPTNLLLACARCNGRGGKSDYHPRHRARTRKPADTTGYLVLDVRVDDFAELFEIGKTGEIAARRGPSVDRANWNIALLKLDLSACARSRKELLDLAQACERLAADSTPKDEEVLANLLPYLRGRLLFFDVYGIPLSDRLRERLAAAT